MSIELTSTPTGDAGGGQAFSGVDVQTSPSLVGNAVHEEVEIGEQLDFVVGVFYDGTLNNRLNVQSREAYESALNEEPHDEVAASRFILADDGGTSFYNDESNVSRLEPYYPERDEPTLKVNRLYIEGIGTEDYEEDSFGGYAFGMGHTGVKGKVKIGCEKVVDIIKRSGETEIQTLTIDTFGFSRGAAAARHFVHEITKKKGDIKQVIASGSQAPPTILYYTEDRGLLGEGLANAGVKAKRLIIRFAGLYDTVPSVGLPFNHRNNTRELGLDAVRKSNHVVHLTAADEHRSTFSLTNIASAGDKGKEVALPGVHSDIGGGYIHNVREQVTLETNRSDFAGLQEEREYLMNEGWYLADEIVANNATWPRKNTLIGTRASISNRYSYIPLHMMCKFATDKAGIAFESGALLNTYTIQSIFLQGVKDLLFEHAFHGGEALTLARNRILVRQLRNQFFHFSAHFDGFLAPMKPRYVGDQRTRQIFPG